MKLTREILLEIGVSEDRADRFLDPLNQALPTAEIDTPLRLAHFLAQILHESARLARTVENLNYSAERLLQVFPRHFTPDQARDYHRQPTRIGSRVYADRLGNGDEASGDGYRYRGRGLIQLTGKSNYRTFARSTGEDFLAFPERVAREHAVEAATFFWLAANINALADRDDVSAVTRAINGEFNGLSDRLRLLDRAKELLAAEPPAIPGGEFTHEVIATQLNLRSEPRVSARNRIGTLAQGTPLVRLGPAREAGWSRVRVMLNGRMVEGYVATRYLKAIRGPVVDPPMPAPEQALPVAHLPEGRRDITRARDGGRAYPLGEPRLPRRGPTPGAARADSLLAIAAYLAADAPAHLRYQPKGGTTYGNIYAYDYCYLAGVYLPRVWWTGRALGMIHEGEEVDVRYGESVRELTSNTVHDWLEDFGSAFGWQRVLDLDELQAAANQGDACIVVAQRTDLNRSGHIAAVVPESETVRAERSDAGEVKVPVQSQAGQQNYRASTAPGRWWTSARFRAFSFWRHG